LFTPPSIQKQSFVDAAGVEGEGDDFDGFEDEQAADAPSAGAVIAAQGEYDRLAGATRTNATGGGKGATSGAKQAHVPHPPRLDKNVILTQSEDWGHNRPGQQFEPPVLPQRPNSRQRVLTSKLMGGEKVRNPRDRDPPSSRPSGPFSRARKAAEIVVPSTLLQAGSKKKMPTTNGRQQAQR
jgi:hypothetical protein